MSDPRSLLERESRRFIQPDGAFERLVHRRDRKRRNQRIAAGVVGLAVFMAAVWMVTSVSSLDRSETSLVPGGDVTGPADTGPAETGPAEIGPTQTAPPDLAHASGEPDVVRQTRCSQYSKSRLELTKMGPITVVGGHSMSEAIRVRYEVHRSPVGHEWRFSIRNGGGGELGHAIFRGIRIASDSGQWAVELRVPWPQAFHPKYTATAIDTQTGQACRVEAGF